MTDAGNHEEPSPTERQRQVRTEAERERSRLYELLMQAPALICIVRGPTHVFELVNPPFQQLN